jgi:DNA-binding CsgD family transcriptional regulator
MESQSENPICTSRELDLNVCTVETHQLNIKSKIGIEGKTHLMRFAQELTYGAYAVA